MDKEKEKQKVIICKQSRNIQLCQCVFLISFVFTMVLLCFNYSPPPGAVSFLLNSFAGNQTLIGIGNVTVDDVKEDPCSGKYIYIHSLPTRFNTDLFKDCRKLIKWYDMCPSLTNSGFGPKVMDQQRVLLSNSSWFDTNQFLLSVIFHNRMKQYKCLTNDSASASAIYVPFYAGLDIGRYLWGFNTSVRDSSAYDLANWLKSKPEWKRMLGRDHFFVAGRIAWDFRRQAQAGCNDWGSLLMYLPEFMNMTMLAIESTSWSNEFAIPYPTYFHPSSDNEVINWQKRVRRRKRRYLFSFAGAPRPSLNDSIRGEIISQCLASKHKCNFLRCQPGANKCEDPVEVMNVFQDSIFCLQPAGDSYTRRSTFDSILAGCIPVFFHPYSAYAQYIWHLPKNYSKYSVFIPANDIKRGGASIREALSRFSKGQVLAMRKQVVKLIPKVIYANPWSELERFEDAFDIAVKKVVERVEKVREDIKELGKDPSVDFAVENSWKLKLSGIVGDHPLDQFLD